jgi:hypothetical protein
LFLVSLVFALTVAGPLGDQEDENAIPHSPRTKGIIQHFERQMRLHLDGLAEDIHVTNERLGPLETAQIEAGTALQELRTAQATTNTTLGTIMTWLEELSQQLGELQGDTDYGGDTEHDAQARRRRHGRRRGVRKQDDFFSKIKLTIPESNGTYDPDAYLEWELAIDQKFACHAFPAQHQVKAATSGFTHFASIWWREHCNKPLGML